jgi:glycosyltransferase involved in cell wall biosynthesis
MVLSSVWPEPFGAVGLEGMRYGLPVVAFDAGGIREWLINNETGFLVPWMDRAQFAARVEELLLNKTLARQMGERGARVVAERFEFSDYITALENTFTQVVSEAEEEKVHA